MSGLTAPSAPSITPSPGKTCLQGHAEYGPDYRLGFPLTLRLVAVLGGATSLAAIARFAADTDSDQREQLRLASGTPNPSTLGRLLSRLDSDALDDTVGAWLARYAAHGPGRRPGHGDQAPPHPPQDRQGRDEDLPRGHQPAA
ncbi:transposase family protein [Streptomyces sp. NBC_00696]|uniref:transposase family protein n=1 Tax=Streptomyces sp. NBC_00696 TaxID=2903672 RepID=UPI003FA71876